MYYTNGIAMGNNSGSISYIGFSKQGEQASMTWQHGITGISSLSIISVHVPMVSKLYHLFYKNKSSCWYTDCIVLTGTS